jgi:hypothetical protein
MQNLIKLLIKLFKSPAHFIIRPKIDRKVRIANGFEKIGKLPVHIRDVLVQQRPLDKNKDRSQYIHQHFVGMLGSEPCQGNDTQDNNNYPDHDHYTEVPKSEH